MSLGMKSKPSKREAPNGAATNLGVFRNNLLPTKGKGSHNRSVR